MTARPAGPVPGTPPPADAAPGYRLAGPRLTARLRWTLGYAVVTVVGFAACRLLPSGLPVLDRLAQASPFGTWFFGLATLALTASVAMQLVRPPVALRVGTDGVEYGRGTLPWASIWQVVVLRPAAGAGAFAVDLPPQLGFRLKRGAPLPKGITSLVTDPARPLDIPDVLRTDVRDALVDGPRLIAALRRCAPPEVLLVERQGDREHPLPR